MKLRNTALNALFYFLYMLTSCVITMLVEALLVYIAEKFVAIPYPVLTVLRALIYTLGVLAILAAIGYYEGFREGVCPLGEVIPAGILAILPHLILGLLFNFQAFVAGGVRHTAGLLHEGAGISAATIGQTPTGLLLLVFVGYGLLYAATLVIARYIGAQKRIIERAELRRNEVPDDAEDA